MLLQHNAPAHSARVAYEHANSQCINHHPPYLPDLAHYDYYLFRHVKKHTTERQFCDGIKLQVIL